MRGGQVQTGLTILAGPEATDYVIRLIGEFDLESQRAVEAAIADGEASAAQRVIIDVGELEFIDSTGLGVLLSAKKRSDVSGLNLRFTRARGDVREFFRLTAMDLSLPFVDPAP
jgi:anti-sigma B factor antagonist